MMNNKKKLLYIASRPFLPVSGGRERMLAQYMRILSKFYLIDLVVFCGRSEVVNPKDYEVYIGVNCIVQEVPNIFTVVSNVVFNRGSPFQVSLYYDKSTLMKLSSKLNYDDYFLVIADMARTASYILEMPIKKKVVDFDDLLSLRYERLKDRNTTSILGTYGERIPRFFKSYIVMFSDLLVRQEALRMKKWESYLGATVDGIILTSPKEASLTAEKANCPVVDIMPSVDSKLRNNEAVTLRCKVFRIGFLGNMKTIQNQESLFYVVDKILPLLDRKGINYELIIVGGIDQEFKSVILSKLKANSDKVFFKGFVEDISLEVSVFSMLAAPLFSGTGIKTKILDAMSCGVPVVTTDIGCEGLGIENKKHILIANSDESFVACVEWIIGNPGAVINLVNQALTYLDECHNEAVIADRLHSFLELIEA